MVSVGVLLVLAMAPALWTHPPAHATEAIKADRTEGEQLPPPVADELLTLDDFPGHVVEDFDDTAIGSDPVLPEESPLLRLLGRIVTERARIEFYQPEVDQFVFIEIQVTPSSDIAEALFDPALTQVTGALYGARYSELPADPSSPLTPLFAEATKGPVHLRLGLARPGASAAELRSDLDRLLEAQYRRVNDRPDGDVRDVALTDIRLELISTYLSRLITLPILLLAIAAIRDRRVRTLFTRFETRHDDRSTYGGLDLTARTRAHRRRDLRRGLLFGGGITAAFAAGILAPLTTSRSLALIVGLLLGLEVVRRFLVRRTFPAGETAPADTGRGSRAATAIAVAFSLGLGAAGLQILNLAALFGLFGVPNSSPDAAGNFVVGLTFVGLGVLSLTPGPVRLAHRWTRKQPNRDGPTFMLLRSFVDDRLRLRVTPGIGSSILRRLAQNRWQRFEEHLVTILHRHGQVWTVEEPGRRVRPLGAHRHPIPTGPNWLAEVEILSHQADRIFVIGGRTWSLLDEIGMLRRAGLLERTTFVFPPIGDREVARRAEVVASLLKGESRTIEVPDKRSLVTASFDSNGDLRLATFGITNDDLTLTEAFEVALTSTPGPEFEPAMHRENDVRGLVEPAASLILPPGSEEAKPSRPWYARVIVIIFILNFLVRGCADILEPFPPVETRAVTGLTANRPADLDRHGDELVVALGLDSAHLMSVDLAVNETLSTGRGPTGIELVVSTGSSILAADRDGGRLHYLEWRAGPGDELWSVTIPTGGRALAVVADLIFLSFPADNQIIVLALADGAEVRTIEGLAAPWDVVAAGGSVLVTLANGDEVIELDPTTGSITRRFPVLAGPRRMVAEGDQVYVSSILTDGVTEIDLRSGTIRELALDREVYGEIGLSDDSIFLGRRGPNANVTRVPRTGPVTANDWSVGEGFLTDLFVVEGRLAATLVDGAVVVTPLNDSLDG